MEERKTLEKNDDDAVAKAPQQSKFASCDLGSSKLLFGPVGDVATFNPFNPYANRKGV
jgi:hypothetical protein